MTINKKKALLRIIITAAIIILLLFIFGGKLNNNSLTTGAGTKNSLTPALKEALHWVKLNNKSVQCGLCPRNCRIMPGQKGFCRGRKNLQGRLYSLTYGQPVAVHVDPIEKKPLAHVYPGTKSFSIATAGCNLRCKFCQNWEISQLDPERVGVDFISPEEIVSRAKASGSKTIAFTYTEPTIFYEYMLEIAKLAKKEKIDCIIHSAGYINEKPLREIAKYLKAANIDLKGFTEKYYKSFCEGSLKAVLNSLKILKDEGVWIEVTNLLIPGGNDSNEDITNLCLWIKENLGEDTPVHFSRFFPMYKLTDLSPTPISTLTRAQNIAKENGLKFIYIGNIPENIGEDTYCPECSNLLVKRIGYKVLENNIKDGKCPYCLNNIAGIWN